MNVVSVEHFRGGWYQVWGVQVESPFDGFQELLPEETTSWRSISPRGYDCLFKCTIRWGGTGEVCLLSVFVNISNA